VGAVRLCQRLCPAALCIGRPRCRSNASTSSADSSTNTATPLRVARTSRRSGSAARHEGSSAHYRDRPRAASLASPLGRCPAAARHGPRRGARGCHQGRPDLQARPEEPPLLGRVTRQRPAAGTQVAPGTQVTVTLGWPWPLLVLAAVALRSPPLLLLSVSCVPEDTDPTQGTCDNANSPFVAPTPRSGDTASPRNGGQGASPLPRDRHRPRSLSTVARHPCGSLRGLG
jgi:PASTA domain